jgi:hypothetical protein
MTGVECARSHRSQGSSDRQSWRSHSVASNRDGMHHSPLRPYCPTVTHLATQTPKQTKGELTQTLSQIPAPSSPQTLNKVEGTNIPPPHKNHLSTTLDQPIQQVLHHTTTPTGQEPQAYTGPNPTPGSTHLMLPKVCIIHPSQCRQTALIIICRTGTHQLPQPDPTVGPPSPISMTTPT